MHSSRYSGRKGRPSFHEKLAYAEGPSAEERKKKSMANLSEREKKKNYRAIEESLKKSSD